MRFILILISTFLILSNCKVQSKPKAIDGVIDLRKYDFNNRSGIELDGNWEFYWSCLIYSKPETCNNAQKINYDVPNIWNQTVIGDQKISGFGFASYKLKIIIENVDEDYSLKILDMATTYNLWFNGEKVASNGQVGIEKESSNPKFLPKTYRLGKIKHENEIVVEISNFHHYKGGFWESVTFGETESIFQNRENKIWLDLFLVGSISIMFIYHLGLYVLRRKDISSFYFALFCFIILVRLSVTGERILFYKIPNIDWEIGNKLEYATFFFGLPGFQYFLQTIFTKEFKQWVGHASLIGSILLTGLLFVQDISVYSRTALWWQLLIIIVAIYNIVSLIKSITRKRDGAFASLIGFLFFVLTVVNDILYANNVINTSYLLPFGLFLFIFFQSFLISLRFSKAFIAVEFLSNDLQKTNEAYSRFVPREFLSFLDKKSITDVKLGDQVQKEMTVLFSDIRGFTSLSETMTPQENFNFLNSYLKIMEPAISRYDGFIDKYIGDAIMALFPYSPDDALNASILMLKELKTYNINRNKVGYKSVQIGIGLNTGNLMLGTIGTQIRMDGTVISDAVNLASRLETLTKEMLIPIILSENVYNSLENKSAFNIREIDKVVVKGKSKPITIYECFDGDLPELIERKNSIMEEFSLGIKSYYIGSLHQAKIHFNNCLQKCPEDPVLFIYLNRCNL